MTLPVKWFASSFRGAPTLNGQAGTLVATLKACLVDGFGEVTPSAVTVSGGVATATHSADDFFEDYAVIKISGASDADLNGEARVISHTSTTTSWATTATDGSKTGTIKIRYAPVGGWEQSYSKTDVAVFKSTDAAANGHYLRVADNYSGAAAQNGRVVGYTGMTGVDTGTGPFPTNSQISGGGYWRKSQLNNADAVPWWIVGDSRFFVPFFLTGYPQSVSYVYGVPYAFGDPIAMAPGGDSWSTMLASASANVLESTMLYGSVAGINAFSSYYGGLVAARALGGAGGAKAAAGLSFCGQSAIYVSGSDPVLGAGPSTVDGRVFFSQRYLALSDTDKTPRAIIPGVAQIPQQVPEATFANGDTVAGTGSLAGRRVMLWRLGDSPGAFSGVLGIDITGPWR